jgi:hypothetical protein
MAGKTPDEMRAASRAARRAETGLTHAERTAYLAEEVDG